MCGVCGARLAHTQHTDDSWQHIESARQERREWEREEKLEKVSTADDHQEPPLTVVVAERFAGVNEFSIGRRENRVGGRDVLIRPPTTYSICTWMHNTHQAKRCDRERDFFSHSRQTVEQANTWAKDIQTTSLASALVFLLLLLAGLLSVSVMLAAVCMWKLSEKRHLSSSTVVRLWGIYYTRPRESLTIWIKKSQRRRIVCNARWRVCW